CGPQVSASRDAASKKNQRTPPARGAKWWAEDRRSGRLGGGAPRPLVTRRFAGGRPLVEPWCRFRDSDDARPRPFFHRWRSIPTLTPPTASISDFVAADGEVPPTVQPGPAAMGAGPSKSLRTALIVYCRRRCCHPWS